MAAEAGQGLLSAVTSYARGDMSGVFKSAMGLVKTATGNTQKAERITKATKTSPADVVRIKPILLLPYFDCGITLRFLGAVAKILKLVQMLMRRVKLLEL